MLYSIVCIIFLLKNCISLIFFTDLVPLFLQDPISYMSYTAIPDAYHQYDLEISIHPQTTDGTILQEEHYVK